MAKQVKLKSGHVVAQHRGTRHHKTHRARHHEDITLQLRHMREDAFLMAQLRALCDDLSLSMSRMSDHQVIARVSNLVSRGGLYFSDNHEPTWASLRSPILYDRMIVKHAGKGYSTVKTGSHYDDAIATGGGRAAGNSRKWGDASPEVQKVVIDALIAQGRKAGLTIRETAHLLVIARVESGYNPDAAAGTTSASGLGQFIDATGGKLGLDDTNRFDIDANAEALAKLFIENRDYAKKHHHTGYDLDVSIYKYHHDGFKRDYGGEKISRDQVAPKIDEFLQAIAGH